MSAFFNDFYSWEAYYFFMSISSYEEQICLMYQYKFVEIFVLKSKTKNVLIFFVDNLSERICRNVLLQKFL